LKYRISHIIIIFWALVFLFAFIQFYLKPIDVKALDASHKSLKKPVFTINSWSEGSFQDTIKQRHNVNFPFRNDFVRLHNQIEYSLFNNLSTEKVLNIDLKGYPTLFHYKYVKAYTGNQWFDKEKLEHQIEEVKRLQEFFEAKEIHFVYLFAPNKVAFYPEVFDQEENYPRGKYPRLYEFTKERFDQHGIQYIDYHDWFFDLKEAKDSNRIFTDLGAHWSMYGASLVTDSLLRYMKDKDFVAIDSIERYLYLSEEVLYPDNDVEGMLNLRVPLKHKPMPYFKRKEGHEQIPLAFSTIGDSFWWQIWSKNGLANSLTPNHYFMYYGNIVYQKKWGKNIDRKELSSKKKFEMLNRGKLVICISTEHTIPKVINGLLNIVKETDYESAKD
jgi:hypothetical protein